MSGGGIALFGAGHHLPSRVIRNVELCETLSITPEWIEAKTGIQARRVALESEQASTYAYEAARKALEDAKVPVSDVGLIIVATFSADYVFPAAAIRLQSDLGIVGGHAFDVQANCAGFVTALSIAAERLICDHSLKYALVVGLELCSRYSDQSDPETAIFLSDGAGAVVLGRTKGNNYLGSAFWTDSSNYESVRLRGGGSSWRDEDRFASSRHMEMNGLATWRQAITNLPGVIRDAAIKSDLDVTSIDKFIFHQANLRLIEYLMKKMRRPMTDAYTNVQRIGNCGSASIPIAISEARHDGFFNDGDLVCFAGVGAGFAFGASIWRWGSVSN